MHIQFLLSCGHVIGTFSAADQPAISFDECHMTVGVCSRLLSEKEGSVYTGDGDRDQLNSQEHTTHDGVRGWRG
jgi:hypothetical protein